jgi:hypothetical protein
MMFSDAINSILSRSSEDSRVGIGQCLGEETGGEIDSGRGRHEKSFYGWVEVRPSRSGANPIKQRSAALTMHPDGCDGCDRIFIRSYSSDEGTRTGGLDYSNKSAT